MGIGDVKRHIQGASHENASNGMDRTRIQSENLLDLPQGCVLTLITLSLYLTVVLLNEQKEKNVTKINKVTKT